MARFFLPLTVYVQNVGQTLPTTSTSDIHTSASTNSAWNTPWSSFRQYYQLVAIFRFHAKHSFPLITSAGIIRLHKHVPRYKVAFTAVLFIEGSDEVYAYSFDWLFRTVKTNKNRRTCK
jgi:hypothetical protein